MTLINTSLKHLIHSIILLLIVTSCSKVSPLQQALEDAGNNRAELESVLTHYSFKESDSLKYKAAKYLIENMRFHYTYSDSEIENYYNQINHLIHKGNVKNKLNSISKTTLKKPIIIKDIEHVSSNFLISHIDNALLTREYPWNKDLNFTDFCEFVLPYRIKDEPLENWMPIYSDFAKHIADSLYENSVDYKDFIIKLYHYFNENTAFVRKYIFKIKNIPSSLIGIRHGTCQEIAMFTLYTFRSLGIPAFLDFTPNWPNRSLGHDWNGIQIDGRYYPFIIQTKEEFGHHLMNKPNGKFGKIYRNTYTIQEKSLFMQKKNHIENIPHFLSNPYVQDISYLYNDEVSSVKLKLNHKKITPIAYISVFNNKEWIPVGWNKIQKNEVLIQNVQKGCCYLSTIYNKNKLIPITYPFIIPEDGDLKELIPNKDNLQTITLERKYPKFAMERYAQRSVGGEFHGSNNKQFTNYEVLYIVNHSLIDLKWHTISPPSKEKFKYLRYFSAKGGYNNIAEIKFFSTNSIPIHGNIIAKGGYPKSKTGLKENAFDGDPLTFFRAKKPDGSWVGLELNERVHVDKINYLFRNDDNSIRVGDIYELFYWDNKWISLGTKGGVSDSLNYSNCPTNVLFLLRNHTRGKEERIFTYENNKQVFW